jgi:hypothetical protein|nr:MAG TPA: hypothetical protein [Caudoviricetes sp.]
MTELKQKSFSEWLNKNKAPDKINEAANKIDNTVLESVVKSITLFSEWRNANNKEDLTEANINTQVQEWRLEESGGKGYKEWLAEKDLTEEEKALLEAVQDTEKAYLSLDEDEKKTYHLVLESCAANQALNEAYNSNVITKVGILVAKAIKKFGIPALTAVAGIGSGAGLVGGIVGYVVGMVIQSYTSQMVKNRGGWKMIWRQAINAETQNVVYDAYKDVVKDLCSTKDIHLAYKADGKKNIYIKVPNPFGKDVIVRLTIDHQSCEVRVDENGGLAILDTITLQQVNGVRMNNNAFLGRDYKIPARALNYQNDMIRLWFLVVDYVSETYNAILNIYSDITVKLQTKKRLWMNNLDNLSQKFDLSSKIIKEVDAAEAMLRDESLRLQQERDKADKDEQEAHANALSQRLDRINKIQKDTIVKQYSQEVARQQVARQGLTRVGGGK